MNEKFCEDLPSLVIHDEGHPAAWVGDCGR